jgi:hypothetical protein
VATFWPSQWDLNYANPDVLLVRLAAIFTTRSW